MTTLALGYRAIHSKVRSVALPAINIKMVYLFGIFAVVLMLVFYVYAINTLTGGSYAIKNYHKQIDSLEQENKILEAGFAASGFMGSVEQQAHRLGFEKTTQVTYIEIMGNSLAQAR